MISDLINKDPIIFYLIIVVLALILFVIILFICFVIILRHNNKKKQVPHEPKIHDKKKESKHHKNFSEEKNQNNKNEHYYGFEISENFTRKTYSDAYYASIKEKTDIKELKNDLINLQHKYLDSIVKLNKMIDYQNNILSSISNLSIDEAKNLLVNNLYKKMRSNLSSMYLEEKKKFDLDLEAYAQKYLINAMETIAEKTITQRSLTIVPLKDENLKGKIIGKNGRNKHLFEFLTGADIIVEKNAEVTISSANPIRREIAVNLFNAMIESKALDPSKLENLYSVVKQKFEDDLVIYGKNALNDNLKIFDIDPKIYPFVGRLRYRTSYGQNVLEHCIEAAKYAEIIAKEINIDPEKAKRAAFFHDIGKSIDFDENYDHVESGIDIAKKCHLPEYILNAIESHHNKVEPNNIYAALVKVVDTLSAARPGARSDSLNEFIKRINHLEKICKEIYGVKEAYAVQSGRTIRVIIEPSIIKDDELNLLEFEIRQAIENDELINKHQLRIILIREKRYEFYANKKVSSTNSISII